MLVVFTPIFVADTKLIYGNNFVAPLKLINNDAKTTTRLVRFAKTC